MQPANSKFRKANNESQIYSTPHFKGNFNPDNKENYQGIENTVNGPKNKDYFESKLKSRKFKQNLTDGKFINKLNPSLSAMKINDFILQEIDHILYNLFCILQQFFYIFKCKRLHNQKLILYIIYAYIYANNLKIKM